MMGSEINAVLLQAFFCGIFVFIFAIVWMVQFLRARNNVKKRETMHSYGIVQKVEALTNGEMKRIESLYRTMREVQENGKQTDEMQIFTIFQWKQEQDFLRQQHMNGWKFTKLNSLVVYHFEKCEPEDVTYQLDYNPDGIAHKDEYVQMFRDCGWEYLQDYAGYSHFRKAASKMDSDEEVFCDDSSRLDFMKRVFQGRMIPLVTIFFCIIIPQLFLYSHRSDMLGRIFTGIFTVLGVLYSILFGIFAMQYWNAKNH